MNRLWACCLAFFFAGTVSLAAQTDDDVWDIDSIFDDAAPNTVVEEEKGGGSAGLAASLLKRRGFSFSASFEFNSGLYPGWDQALWFSEEDRNFDWSPGVKMNAGLGLDFQISEVLRIKNSFRYGIPRFVFTLDELFFDYTLLDTIFFRGGKYNLAWGISPNYGFTNLLARVPAGKSGGESFILKADVPVGVGGFQVLGMTRADMIGGTVPDFDDFGFGGKFNLALRWVDIDLGGFYQKGMSPRGFFSLKTTIGNTELYNEWMAAFNLKELDRPSGAAANIGFARDFFDGKVTLNGELFFNAEGNAYRYIAETSLRAAETSPYVTGLSGALNLIYRFNGRGDPRIFTQLLYTMEGNSTQFVPGFKIDPSPHLEFYAALPMAMGRKDGYYYTHPFITDNKGRLRRISLILLLTVRGSFQHGWYF